MNIKTPNTLPFEYLFDLFLRLIELNDFYWNLYLAFILAIVGWLISIEKPFNIQKKTILTIGFFLFASMNFRAIRDTYDRMIILFEQLTPMAEAIQFGDGNFTRFLNEFTIPERKSIGLATHILADIVVLVLIWYDKLLKKDKIPEK